jgi:hypothetical protein
MLTGFWWGTLEVEDHLKEVAVDGKIIQKLMFK